MRRSVSLCGIKGFVGGVTCEYLVLIIRSLFSDCDYEFVDVEVKLNKVLNQDYNELIARGFSRWIIMNGAG